jgi:ComF family protein
VKGREQKVTKQPIDKVKGFFAGGLEMFNRLVWAKRCINCREVIFEAGGDLCSSCGQQLNLVAGGDYCRRCGRNVSEYAVFQGSCSQCREEEIFFDAIARCGIYEQSLREMILSFKCGRMETLKTLGFLANSALAGSSFVEDIEFFVPVPLHWTRKVHRGYNQSLVLAKRLKHPAAKVNTDFARIRRTKMQTSMASVHQRLKNVEGAFAVRHRHPYIGKKVCLVDDIKTTGATLNECARQLKDAGAAKVFALVLAVADQRVD